VQGATARAAATTHVRAKTTRAHARCTAGSDDAILHSITRCRCRPSSAAHPKQNSASMRRRRPAQCSAPTSQTSRRPVQVDPAKIKRHHRAVREARRPARADGVSGGRHAARISGPGLPLNSCAGFPRARSKKYAALHSAHLQACATAPLPPQRRSPRRCRGTRRSTARRPLAATGGTAVDAIAAHHCEAMQALVASSGTAGALRARVAAEQQRQRIDRRRVGAAAAHRTRRGRACGPRHALMHHVCISLVRHRAPWRRGAAVRRLFAAARRPGRPPPDPPAAARGLRLQ